MSERARAEGVAVVCDRQGQDAAAVAAYLQGQGVADAVWYAPRDADQVDEAVRAGTVGRVVFPAWSDFLLVLWDDVLTPEAWPAAGVSVELVGGDGTAATVLAEWQRWRRRQRRRRAWAGLVLSGLAVAAACVLLALVR
jgi:peptidoglycan/LPS O-acetylase OafA/YrhL